MRDRHEFIKVANHNLSEVDIRLYFYDIYALDYLYYLVKTKEVPSRVINFINNLREDRVFTFANAISDATERSIRSECAYLFRSDINPSLYSLNNGICNSYYKAKFFKENNIDFKSKQAQYDLVELRFIKKGFSQGFKLWDDSYGGKAWLKACEALEKLNSSIDKYNINDICLWTDHILDLEHNSGNLLNKTEFSFLSEKYYLYPNNHRNHVEIYDYFGLDKEVSFGKKKYAELLSHFDNRCYLKSLRDYIPFCSTRVTKTIKSNLNRINKNE